MHPTDPNKTASIGAQLDPAVDAALHAFPHENWDIFAWHPSDMLRIPRRLAEHSLNIIKGSNQSNKHCGDFPNPNDKLWERS